MKEIWKAVVGFEGLYEVSDQGRVRGLNRLGSDGRRLAGKLMKSVPSPRGYCYVDLRRDGCYFKLAVAFAVLNAFVGSRPAGKEIAHENGKRADNRAVNLKWKTHAANLADRERHGTMLRGQGHPNAKLTEQAVRVIRRAKCTQQKLADRFGVTQPTISGVRHRQGWAHV